MERGKSKASAAPPNVQLQLTGRFLRSSGHPELTIQECANAEIRTTNDLPI